MIPHDRLFKELITTFFWEFLELFLPDVVNYIEPNSITFLTQEIFTDITSGERREVDLLASVKFQGKNTFFLIHIENQAYSQSGFAQRMFYYFARLHEKYDLPIYPVVVFSYDEPKRLETNQYQVIFPDRQILQFNYEVIQLNRLPWRSFLEQQNPVAAALMAKMQFSPSERPKVKLECLRMLTSLRLDPARMQLISGFIDTYLRLDSAEEQTFQVELNKLELVQEEKIMEIVTSWMEKGIEQGIEQGKIREINLVLRLLHRRLGSVSPELQQQIQGLSLDIIEELGEALFDFNTEADLLAWLAH